MNVNERCLNQMKMKLNEPAGIAARLADGRWPRGHQCRVQDSPRAEGRVVVRLAHVEEVRPQLTSGQFEHDHQQAQSHVAKEVGNVGSHNAPGAGVLPGGGVPSVGLAQTQTITRLRQEHL